MNDGRTGESHNADVSSDVHEQNTVAGGGRVGVIGCGNLGTALVRGLVSAGSVAPAHVVATVSPTSARGPALEQLGIRVVPDNLSLVPLSDVVIVAVKPVFVPAVLDELAGAAWRPGQLLVSVAGGITLHTLEAHIGEVVPVIRAMPNLAAAVAQSATALAPGRTASGEDVERVRQMFESVGRCYVVREALMDAVTALSGSGVAFAAIMLDALADGGVAAGLPRPVATDMALQTVLGTCTLLADSGAHSLSPAALKDAVASPAGTSMAGIRTLEAAAFRSALIEAVVAAAERAAELANPL